MIRLVSIMIYASRFKNTSTVEAHDQSKGTDLLDEVSLWLVLCPQGFQNWGEILAPSFLVVEKWGAWISIFLK
jgi:hypothetical protein